MPAKILYISNFGDLTGGGEISLLSLLGCIDRSRFEPLLLVPHSGEVSRRAEELGIAVEVMALPRLKSPVAVAGLAGKVAALRGLIKSSGVALVHANTSPRPALYAGLAAKAAGVPSLWHVRILDRDPLTDKLVFGLFDAVVANSNATRGRFDGFSGADKKITVVHNAVDTEAFTPGAADEELRREFGAGPGQMLVGFAARLEGWKGPDRFLEAARMLAAAGHGEMRFVLAGEGPLEGECRRIASLPELEGRVCFAGKRHDMERFMRAIDALVLASDAEHFGRVVIEAMACGKPVVATNAGGVPEIIDDGVDGLLVPPGDPAAIASALERLADDPSLRDAISARARKKAVGCFSLGIHADRIMEIYSQLLDE